MSKWYQVKKDDIDVDEKAGDLNVYLDSDNEGNIYAEIKLADVRDLIDKEIIICSAVKTPKGLIVRGHRHCDCYNNLSNRPDYKDPKSVAFCEEGFITSKNRYVGREEAMQIQLRAGIASADPGGYRGEMLFSEDLY